MNEVNAILTTGAVESAPATGWPDAKREASQLSASAAPPLAGRRCPHDPTPCVGSPCPLRRVCEWLVSKRQGTGERSGPANDRHQATASARRC